MCIYIDTYINVTEYFGSICKDVEKKKNFFNTLILCEVYIMRVGRFGKWKWTRIIAISEARLEY